MLAQPIIDTLPGGIEQVVSPGPTSWEGESGWQLELVHEITGEEGTPSEVINPNSLAVDEWGRVFVVDQKPAVIKVYGTDGRFIRTIGGEGAGPGEFRTGFIAVRHGVVVVQDPRVNRVTVWDTSGTMLRNWHSTCCYFSDIQIDPDGLIHVPSVVRLAAGQSRPPGIPYLRWTLEGELRDTLWVPTGPEDQKYWSVTVNQGGQNTMALSTAIPLMPRLLSGYHPDGGFLIAWSGGYRIARAPHAADTTRLFGRAWTPDPVSAERRQFEVETMANQFKGSYGEENLRRSFRTEDIPGVAPAFVALHADRAGNSWIRLDPGLDTTRTRFDVYDPAGVLLGTVAVASALPRWGQMAFGRDELVAARETADGIPVVARYRLVR